MGRGLALLLLQLLWMACAAPAMATHAPRAEQGRLVLPAGLEEPVALDGEWGFAWQKFLDPEWQKLPARAFVGVPANWNAATADGKPPGQDGWGSYVLQVDCPPGESLAVEAFAQRTASRLFINGAPVAMHGNPGPSAQLSYAAVHRRTPITREFSCPLRLTLHVSNFDHRAGGFVRPLYAGPAPVLERAREGRLIRASLLESAYVLTALVALMFFAVRRRERTPLVYGLFCLAMVVYADAIGERMLLRLLPHPLSWVAFMRLEYLSWIAAMALFLLTLHSLFPEDITRRVVLPTLAVLGAAAACVLALPPAIYSHVALPGQAAAVLVGAYIASALFRARRRSPIDARILLAGLVAVVVALGIDLVRIDSDGPDSKFAPVGFALFLLSPALVIGRRLSRALNAEETARLREDVERISRHDLKTPLNSILGGARLLREDARLAPDQRELVGVLQRAGLRMLEMVNLSLGLYRMETGTYAFQPQAVDLREVAASVVTDLQSYAQASSVALHTEPGAGPAVVRGEDLLCYSIVANLVKNAIEAAGAGQTVRIAIRPGDPVTLSVSNPGEVPPDIAGRFFDKYVTSKKSGGTGLGTYSARLMAQTQQGDLQLRTGTAQGTTVVLSLPAFVGEASQPLARAPVAAQQPWPASLPRQVLVADDDELNRFITARMLPAPFAVRSAINGQAAIDAMQQAWPHYLVIDMEMPVKGGIETVQWLRGVEAGEGRPRCGVIMLSGNDDDASVQRALAAGADRYLTKPVNRDALLAALRELEGLDADGGTTSAPPMPSPGPDVRTGAAPQLDDEWAGMLPAFIGYQRKTLNEMAAAVATGDRLRVQFLAHRAAGGLGMLRLEWAAEQCRGIESQASDAPLEDLGERIDAVSAHLAGVEGASG